MPHEMTEIVPRVSELKENDFVNTHLYLATTVHPALEGGSGEGSRLPEAEVQKIREQEPGLEWVSVIRL